MPGFQDVADGFEGSIACIVGQQHYSTRTNRIRGYRQQEPWLPTAMIDGTLPLLIQRTQEAEHLLSNKGLHCFCQGVLTLTQELLRSPVLLHRVGHRSSQASNARANIFATVEERLPDM